MSVVDTLHCEFPGCKHTGDIHDPHTGLILCFDHASAQHSDVKAAQKALDEKNVVKPVRASAARSIDNFFVRLSGGNVSRKTGKNSAGSANAQQTTSAASSKRKRPSASVSTHSSAADTTTHDAKSGVQVPAADGSTDDGKNSSGSSDDSSSSSGSSYEASDADSGSGDEVSLVNSAEDAPIQPVKLDQFMHIFRQPEQSHLSRTRKQRTPPVKSVETAKMKHKKSDPKHVSPAERVTKFKKLLPLQVVSKELMCVCCNRMLAVKDSTIRNHARSQSHQTRLKAYEQRNARRQQLLVAPSPYIAGSIANLTERDRSVHFVPIAPDESAANLPALLGHRLDVAHAFLVTGAPFSLLRDVDGPIRQLLELGRGSLPEREVVDLVPELQRGEFSRVAAMVRTAGPVAIAFDTTDRLTECFGVTVRFVTPTNTIETRCLDFRLLAKSLNANEICAILVDTLCAKAGVPLDAVHYAARDGAAVEGAAVAHLQLLCPQLANLTCLSHAFNLAGSRLYETCSRANGAIRKWGEIGGQSHLVRVDFHARTADHFQYLPKVRWFGWRDVACQMDKWIDQVVEVLHNANIGSPALRANLLDLIEENYDELRLELALIVDVGERLAVACYNLEGDGFLAPYAFDTFQEMLSLGDMYTARGENADDLPQLPKVEALLAQMFPHNQQQQRELLLATARKAEACFDKVRDDFTYRLQGEMSLYRGCRLLQPYFVAVNNLEALEEELVFLEALPHVVRHIAALRAELPTYRALAIQANIPQASIENGSAVAGWQFWQRFALRLPAWFRAAKEVALVTTSSASVERLFAVYRQLFNEQQEGAYEDRRAASVMLKYNRAKDREN